jgi:hypothetical protein
MTAPKRVSRRPSLAAPSRSRRDVVVRPVLEDYDASLLDVVDHVLTKGVVVSGDLVIGVAQVDLVYLRVSAILCAADRILPYARPRKKRS